MAHIASCVANLEQASNVSKPCPPLPSRPSTPDKPHTWRMLPPDQQRRYQLFPREKQSPQLGAGGKALSPEKAFALAMGQNAGDKVDKSSLVANLRLRPSQNGQPRRRKVSVPDLGPMTTVHEVPMDSPTIPGRPPLHERSSSAPQETGPIPPRPVSKDHDHHDLSKALDDAFMALQEPTLDSTSPKNPTPLVIPPRNTPTPLLQSKRSAAKLRSDSAPPRESPPVDVSPLGQTLFTPSASTPDLSLPCSATTDGTSATALTTPTSAPLIDSHRASPGPWHKAQAEDGSVALYADDGLPVGVFCGHRRGLSDSSSIMDRGRPRKRVDASGRGQNDGPSSGPAHSKRSESKRGKSSERRAFEELPQGWRPRDALGQLGVSDAASLHKQAYRQAERFEVLRAEDVEALSKELRQLDERTEYLRRTYTSLRTGRRNLHSRICQYLRSPRTARFSHESMLKQEEALAELDASIDDWVTKLEHVDNRRTRVRQKLLEHVAAATLLPASTSPPASSESLQQVLGIRSPNPGGISTPPRSPSRQGFASHAGGSSPSPQRVVAQVPSTILEQPVVEVGQDAGHRRGSIDRSPKRAEVESIRVYAGGDVFALLADVEKEISRMSSEPSLEQRRRRNHEALGGRKDPDSLKNSLSPFTATNWKGVAGNRLSPTLPPPPTPPLKDNKPADNEILLTNAVFKP